MIEPKEHWRPSIDHPLALRKTSDQTLSIQRCRVGDHDYEFTRIVAHVNARQSNGSNVKRVGSVGPGWLRSRRDTNSKRERH
jgi:hypothetical protein